MTNPTTETEALDGVRFTPGPYEVWPSLYEGYGASVVVNTEPLRTLAQVREYRDAVLFAAAPDLYEALKAIDFACFRYTGEDQDGVVSEAYDKLRAALAKADGRLPPVSKEGE